MKGILGYRDAHFWDFVPGEMVGTFHLHVTEDTNPQEVLAVVSKVFKERHKLQKLTVQIEKEVCFVFLCAFLFF